MTRIDHAAEAVNFLRGTVIDTYGDHDRKVSIAQVHAALALVEQQRIANIIAWTTRDGQTPIAEVRNIIAEGLGL